MDTGPLLQLATIYGCGFVQVVCSASPATLERRYRQRTLTGERHPGHTESESLDDTVSRLLGGRWEALALPGPVITVNTDAEVELNEIISTLRRAL
jgi:hypothetical protein